MRISKKKFRQIAENLLHFINKEQITRLEDLEAKLGKRYEIDKRRKGRKEFVEVSLRPSNLGTKAYTLSYIVEGSGIIIETRLNNILGYSQIIIKLGEVAPSYAPFSVDPYKNIAQNKVLESTNLEKVLKELEVLRK